MRAVNRLAHFFVLFYAAADVVAFDADCREGEDQLHLLQTSASMQEMAKTGSSQRRTYLHHLTSGWNFYHYSLLVLLPITLTAAWFTRPVLDSKEQLTPAFKRFRLQFLLTWGICVGADWLQGAYVFALYESFGYSSQEINYLFVVGFGSSMLFGTLVGALGDTFGRKRAALLYCVVYIISCCTKHSNQYGWLFFGRVTGGIATSLLFSCFECWLVAEVNEKKKFGAPLLRYMLSMMYFVSFLTAIFTGVIAQTFVDAVPMKSVPGYPSLHYGGNILPFDLSAVLLMLAFPLIALTWDENYGSDSSPSLLQTYSVALKALVSSPWIVMIGMVVALFEGAMYAFVIKWTPALEIEGAPTVPHGLVFSGMMMSCMLGSSVCSFFHPDVSPSRVLCSALVIAAASFALMSWASDQASYVLPIYCGILVFELTVGLYYPSAGAIKSEVVPEHARAGVYNLFRVPLNFVVCVIILTDLSTRMVFSICALLMAASVLMLQPLLWQGSMTCMKEAILNPLEASSDIKK